MSRLSLLFLGVFIGVVSYVNSQTYDGVRGYSVYKNYDKSFITPDYRRKNSVSLGFISSANSAFTEDFFPGFGMHLGYNYLIYTQRKKKKLRKKKVKYYDEVKMGFGFHLGILNHSELFASVKYYYPLVPIRGKTMSWFLFSELGFGYHKLPSSVSETNETKANLSLELFRVRFGKSPLHFHTTANYAIFSNNLFIKEPIDMGIIVGLRYYIHKNHKL